VGTVAFEKYQAAENDFLIVDHDHTVGVELADLARALCPRRGGVGADGLLRVTPEAPGYRVVVINADGGRAELSGNGLRCAARYLEDRRQVPADGLLTLLTDAGPVSARRDEHGWSVDLGTVFADSGPAPTPEPDIELDVDGRRWRGWAVSMGNPHLVIHVKDDGPAPSLARVGVAAATHAAFPEGVNVELARVRGLDHIEVRVWERGVGETRACGSGACATAAALITAGVVRSPVEIEMPGGTLGVRWDGTQGAGMWLSGPAQRVFAGRFAGIGD
jgi:diaminopimelate epimerase